MEGAAGQKSKGSFKQNLHQFPLCKLTNPETQVNFCFLLQVLQTVVQGVNILRLLFLLDDLSATASLPISLDLFRWRRLCDGSGRFLFTTPFLTSFDRCRTRFSGSSRSGSSRGSNGRSRSSGGRGRRRDRGNRGWDSLDCRCLPFGLSRFWLDFGRLRRAGGARYMARGHSTSNGRSCLSRRRRHGRRFGRSRSSMGFLAVSEGWRLCRLPVSKGRRGSCLCHGV